MMADLLDPIRARDAVAVLVSGGRNYRGKGARNEGEQGRNNNEALHLIFPLRIRRAGGTDADDGRLPWRKAGDTNGHARQ